MPLLHVPWLPNAAQRCSTCAAFARELDGLLPTPATGMRGIANEWRARAMRAQGFEAQARARGLRLTYHGVHLTVRGAELAVCLIWPWLADVPASERATRR